MSLTHASSPGLLRQPSGERLIIRELAETFRIRASPSVALNEMTSIDSDDPDHLAMGGGKEISAAVVIGRADDMHENMHENGSDSLERNQGMRCSLEGTTMIDVKKSHLLALIGIEAFAAGITMMWDVIIWFSIAEDGDSNTCNHFLSHIPAVESVVYIISRALALLVPHWAVFFVLYWLDRDLHRPYNPHWDVDLRNVELQGLPGVPSPHTATAP